MMAVRQEIRDEHELYPVHEEDTLPERPAHERQVRYLRSVLELRLPQCWVTGEVCMYWEERAFHRYVAPDVLVVEGSAEAHPHDVFLAWSDGPALLVVEVGSKSTFREDEGPKVERYLLDLGVRDYVYFRPHRNPRRRALTMWRLQGEDIVEVAPNESGRLVSEAVDLEFGLDADGFLTLYDRDGRPLPSPEALQVSLEEERQRSLALEQEVERLREELRRREPSTGGD